jgi:hypothetical protein
MKQAIFKEVYLIIGKGAKNGAGPLLVEKQEPIIQG